MRLSSIECDKERTSREVTLASDVKIVHVERPEEVQSSQRREEKRKHTITIDKRTLRNVT